MKRAEIEVDQVRNKERIEEIARLRLHESKVDAILDEFAKKAAEEFELPISMVSVVMDEAQAFAAAHGLEGWIKEAGGIPVAWSFCANSVQTGEPFVVEDAESEALTKDNPLVSSEGIKCYAGVPLKTSRGYTVGNFCVVGVEERSFTGEEIDRLGEFAVHAMKRIEARVE